MKVFLGIDVGSVSTNIAAVDSRLRVVDTVYLRTQGRPIQAIQQALRELGRRILRPGHSRGRDYRQRSAFGRSCHRG